MSNHRKWSDDFGEHLDLEMLRTIYAPAEKFRVSEFSYSAGTELGGAALAGKCFLFAGAITFTFKDFVVHLSLGEWAELPAGQYTLKVGNDAESRVVRVWEIPTFDS